jgi:hypothetical protein
MRLNFLPTASSPLWTQRNNIMAMSFDPEKVERWEPSDSFGDCPRSNGEYVKASDYDKLLAFYRRTVSALELEYGKGCFPSEATLALIEDDIKQQKPTA